MSEIENTKKEPKMKAGADLVKSCPICNSSFQEPVATNVNHLCPNPQCGITFCVMVIE